MEELKKGIKIYVYGLLDVDGNVTYIGKSSTPYMRLAGHITDGHCEFRKLKIIDIFYDTEYYYIQKYLNEGIKLFNKQIAPHIEIWNINDIVEIRKLKKNRCRNISTNAIYESISDAAKSLNVSEYSLRLSLKRKTNHLNPEYPIELI